MKKFCIIIFAIFIFVFSGCNSEEFSKNINTRDLELVYTVYTESSISVEITPLVDIQNLKVQICYYQDSNILRQDNEWLELEFLEKGNTYHLMYDLSESYPFDRVALYNISGKKKNNSEDFSQEKRKGIIKSPQKNLNTDLFTLRLDTTQNSVSSYGVLYISSTMDLWDVDFEIYEFFSNQMPKTYLPHDVDKIVANDEISITLHKLLGDDGILEKARLKSVRARTVKDVIVLE